MIHEGASCDYHRVALPFKFIPDEFKAKTWQEADVIVFNRIPTIAINVLETLKGKKKIIADLDDYWNLPTWHPKHLEFKNFHAKDIQACLKIADVVTTTTNHLAEKIKHIHSNVHVIPNALPFGHDQFVPSKIDNRKEIIYAGDHNHKPDVDLIRGIGAIATIAFPGYDLGGRKIQRQPLNTYMSIYDNASISVVPIADGNDDYNKCKSNLKLLEAAAKKIPVIASNVPTYNAFRAPILYDNWKTSIKILQNEEINKEMGQQLFDWANDNYNLFYWNLKRLELYAQ